mmetsp:Transcript_23517/g.57610  ORF Transcript_23517/g.57610 Transcript_23517/m.57610 type:complete len:253 (-) Transcript_23517:376-1134(-)
MVEGTSLGGGIASASSPPSPPSPGLSLRAWLLGLLGGVGPPPSPPAAASPPAAPSAPAPPAPPAPASPPPPPPAPFSLSALALSSSSLRCSSHCTSMESSSRPQRPSVAALNASVLLGGPLPVMTPSAAVSSSSSCGAGSPEVTVTATCAFRIDRSAIWLAACRYLTSRSKVYWQHRTGMRCSMNFLAAASVAACEGEASPDSARISSPCSRRWSPLKRRWNSRASAPWSRLTSSRWQYTNIGYSMRSSSLL